MAATVDSAATAARFEGRRGPLAGLLLRNLLFSILTFGIYRFWGRTHVRRFVWRHTVLLDDALEYLGTGGELFIGFLIAVAALLPVFAAYSLLQFVFADGPDYVLLVLEALYYLVLFFLIQIAIHRMRRYRLTRTAWRGVRFGLGGSSLTYARISFGYGLLTAVTLGLAYPWARAATLGYFARHAYFGTAGIALTPDARWLFRRWVVVIVSLIGALGLFAALNLENFEAISHYVEYETFDSVPYVVKSMVYLPLILLPVSFLLWIRYRVVEYRHMMGCLSIGDTGLTSFARTKFVFWRLLIFVLVMFAIGVLLGAFALSMMIGSGKTGLTHGGTTAVLAIFVPVIVLVLFTGMLRTLFLDIPLLAHACETLDILNAEALDDVVQSSAAAPSYGEGTAEALDVGGF